MGDQPLLLPIADLERLYRALRLIRRAEEEIARISDGN
jgi:hypothetical protein